MRREGAAARVANSSCGHAYCARMQALTNLPPSTFVKSQQASAHYLNRTPANPHVGEEAVQWVEDSYLVYPVCFPADTFRALT